MVKKALLKQLGWKDFKTLQIIWKLLTLSNKKSIDTRVSNKIANIFPLLQCPKAFNIQKLNSNDGSANVLVLENDFDISVGDISLSSLLELEFEPFSSLQEENGNPLLGLQNPESHYAQ